VKAALVFKRYPKLPRRRFQSGGSVRGLIGGAPPAAEQYAEPPAIDADLAAAIRREPIAQVLDQEPRPGQDIPFPGGELLERVLKV